MVEQSKGIKAREQDARVPVIIVANDVNDPDVARALESGAHDVIKRPFEAQQLLDKIADLSRG